MNFALFTETGLDVIRTYIWIKIIYQLKQSEVWMHDSRSADKSRYVIRLRVTYSSKSLRFYRFAAFVLICTRGTTWKLISPVTN